MSDAMSGEDDKNLSAMAALSSVLSEIRERRCLLHMQNVVTDIGREDAVYEICEQIVSDAISGPNKGRRGGPAFIVDENGNKGWCIP